MNITDAIDKSANPAKETFLFCVKSSEPEGCASLIPFPSKRSISMIRQPA